MNETFYETENEAHQPIVDYQSNYDIVMSVLPPFNPVRYTINVTDQVLVWMEWGFIIMSINVGGSAVALFMGPESKLSLKWGTLVCLFMNCAVGLPWILTGTIIRFRLAGARCCGDGALDTTAWYPDGEIYTPVVGPDNPEGSPGTGYQPGVLYMSGAFMKIWIIANWSLMALSIVICGVLYLCQKRRLAKGQESFL
jgi:hypothetical protein